MGLLEQSPLYAEPELCLHAFEPDCREVRAASTDHARRPKATGWGSAWEWTWEPAARSQPCQLKGGAINKWCSHALTKQPPGCAAGMFALYPQEQTNPRTVRRMALCANNGHQRLRQKCDLGCSSANSVRSEITLIFRHARRCTLIMSRQIVRSPLQLLAKTEQVGRTLR